MRCRLNEASALEKQGFATSETEVERFMACKLRLAEREPGCVACDVFRELLVAV